MIKIDGCNKYLKQGTFKRMMIMNVLIIINLILYETLNVKFHQFVMIVFAVCLFLNKILRQNKIFDEMNQMLFRSIQQYKQNQPIMIGTRKSVFFDDQIIQHYVYIKINQYLQDLQFIVNKINDLMTQFLIKLTIIFFLIQGQTLIGADWIFLNFMFLMLNLTQQSISFLKQFFKVQKHYQFFTISVIDSSQINKLNEIKNQNQTFNATKEKEELIQKSKQNIQSKIQKSVQNIQPKKQKNQNIIQQSKQNIQQKIQRNQNIKQLLLINSQQKQQLKNDIKNKMQNHDGQLIDKAPVKKKLFIDIPNITNFKQQTNQFQGKGLFTKK